MRTRNFFFVKGIASAFIVFTVAGLSAQESPSAKTDTPAAGASIAKVESEWEGVTVELISVKRGDGDTITIQFKYANTGSKDFTPTSIQLGGNSASEEVYYVDPKNKKKYTVIEDAQKNRSRAT